MRHTEDRSWTRPARSIGERARRLLADGTQGGVIGVTSRGLFIQTSGAEVVFLSGEDYRGPLTVNIAGDTSWLGTAGQDTRFDIGADSLRLLPSGLRLLLEGAQAWSPPPRTNAQDSASAQRSRILRLTRAAADAAPASGMAVLTPWIAHGCPAAARPSHPQAERCARLRLAFVQGDRELAAEQTRGLLGWGPGLTPSGDDFVLGLLLALVRGGRAGDGWLGLTQAVERQARIQTTAISAGLLACAGHGESDERMIALVDHVQCGVPDSAAAAAAIGAWGATSGWDALAGIGLTVDLPG